MRWLPQDIFWHVLVIATCFTVVVVSGDAACPRARADNNATAAATLMNFGTRMSCSSRARGPTTGQSRRAFCGRNVITITSGCDFWCGESCLENDRRSTGFARLAKHRPVAKLGEYEVQQLSLESKGRRVVNRDIPHPEVPVPGHQAHLWFRVLHPAVDRFFTEKNRKAGDACR